MNKSMVVVMGVLGLTAAAFAAQWPEIQRYLKVRQM